MSSPVPRIFRDLRTGLGDLLFPPLCLHCGALAGTDPALRLLCGDCRALLEPPPPGFVQRQILNRLSPCHIDDLWIAYGFCDPLRSLIHHLKYRRMPGLGRAVGRLAAPDLRDRLHEDAAAVRLLPVPLHTGCRRVREYNQSLVIARGLAASENWGVREDVLLRMRGTATQTRLNRAGRQRNVRAAFQVARPTALARRVAVIVDDVVTTGATLNECARVVRAAGARRVIGAALATPVFGED